MAVRFLYKGGLLGFAAALVISIFDAFSMLFPGTYVPPDYPLIVLLFNSGLWIAFGTASGLVVWLCSRRREDFPAHEHYSWLVYFVVPFSLLLGLLGRISTSHFTFLTGTLGRLRLAYLFSPAYDHHLSFFWVGIVLVFAIIFTKRLAIHKHPDSSLLLEIITVVVLFQFCSNIKGFKIICDQYYYVPLPLPLTYAAGVLAITGAYLLFVLKLDLRIHRQVLCLAMLLLAAAGVLAGAYTVSQNKLHTHYFAGLEPATQRKEATPVPYVIVIVLDTVRADRLAVYSGGGVGKNLEAFAKDSIVFERCISSSPWTLPSHASLFTGLYPTEHGAHHNVESEANWMDGSPAPRPLSKDFITMAEQFKNNSYATAAIIANYGFLDPDTGLNQGFHVYDCSKSIGAEDWLYAFKPVVRIFSYFFSIRTSYAVPYRIAEDINRSAFAVADRLAGAPFFMFINYMDAHTPYNPPQPFNRQFSKKKFSQLYSLIRFAFNQKHHDAAVKSFLLSLYDGEIAYIDQQLGELFKHFKKKGIYDSALIVVTSDHGELFGEHNRWLHKGPMYEGVLRVPLIIKFPQEKRTGREQRPVALSDIYATVLTTCGFALPDYVAEAPFAASTRPVVAEYFDADLGRHRALYEGPLKIMQFEKQNRIELYDVQSDPLEENDLAGSMPDMLSGMQSTLQAWDLKHKPEYSQKRDSTTILTEDMKNALKALGYLK